MIYPGFYRQTVPTVDIGFRIEGFDIFTVMNSTVTDYLQQFRPLSAGEKDTILSFFTTEKVEEGRFLSREGKTCMHLYYICSGILRIVSTSEKGTDRTHYFYRENQICTILKSFDEGTTADAGIQAACDAELLVISRSQLDELFTTLPWLKDVLDRVFQRQLLEKVETRNAYLGVDAETQYRLFVERQPDVALRVPMKDIASYLGITPQSLSRIRRNIH
jgi:CRP-like cAMP-binding protein